MQAQLVKLGIKGGINYANQSGTDITVNSINYNSTDAITSYHIGLVAELKLTDGLAIQPELLYSTQGSKFNLTVPNGGTNYNTENTFKLSYLNIPVKRKKLSDKVIFEGKEVLRCSIDKLINERERVSKLDEIENNPSIKYCYIIKGSYYRPDWCGYTSLKFEAGVYPKNEAVRHAKSVREIRLECVDIEEHNKMINQKISELHGRLL